MPKKNPVAKKRLDKYYHLAKEQGYRSRAAFKLIQLNKKYDFLGSSRTLLDLCAAPGGWLQVAAKYMPVSSVIVGVDLFPIKKISHCETYEEDITSTKCREVLRKAFQRSKIDVVLHDGSPNVGVAWDQDAYSQSELVLSSLKLATEFLKPGGLFITKVFRSRDYNSLLWVFNQLFTKVESTKPSASRNASAEIYVVCKGFLAPKFIDPKFLDPKHVFKELDLPVKPQNILAAKKKTNREGYEDGNYTLFKKCSVVEFLESKSPIDVLSTYNQFVFDERAQIYKENPLTTPEIFALVDDIKLLSRKDFKILLKWRLRIQKEKESKEVKEVQEVVVPEKILTKEEEEAAFDKELSEKITYLDKRDRKTKKKLQRKKIKLQYRKDLKMDLNLKSDEVLITPEELGLFVPPSSATLERNEVSTEEFQNAIIEDAGDILPKEEKPKDKLVDPFVEKLAFAPRDSEDGKASYKELTDKYFDALYDDYIDQAFSKSKKKRKAVESPDIKKALKRKAKKEKEQESMSIFDEVEENQRKRLYPDLPPELLPNMTQEVFADEMGDEESDAEADDENEGGLEESDLEDDYEKLQPNLPKKKSSEVEKRTDLWFSQPIFEGLLDEEDQDENITGKDAPDLRKEQKKETRKREREQKPAKKQKKKKKVEKEEKDEEEEDDTPFIEVPRKEIPQPDSDLELEPEEPPVSDSDYDTDDKKQVLALATVAVRQGKLSEIVDDAYNRYAWNDYTEIPKWFGDEYRKHSQPQLPITKEVANEIRERFKEINARPMQKVAEAKARKKKCLDRKLQKLRKQANNIAETQEMSEASKLRQIQKLYAKTKLEPKKKVTYVVRRQFQTRAGSKTRRSNAAGKTKVVDPRLKKDKRGISKKIDKKKGGKAHKSRHAQGRRHGKL
eukprot:TRINITY_DN2408_c0_g1_i1.p1 TRINITY_DN2408_c0_g1~~TRINITY_DN2408_c0_g1_i1.p1  ORF type:complete len:901 (-),score=272.12 TRINITY_DN2408_c0_g1_i1:86-2788(-)